MQLEELFAEFIQDQQVFRQARKSTIAGYDSAFKYFRSLNPHIAPSDINEKIVRNFFFAIDKRATLLRGAPLRGSTIATYRAKLNTFFDWLKSQKHITENPLVNIVKTKVEYNDKRYLDGPVVEKIFNSLNYGIDWHSPYIKGRNIAIFSTFFYTGIRRSELLNIRLRDVDLQHKTLFINGQTSKSKKDRSIPIHPNLAYTLSQYIESRKPNQDTHPVLFLSSGKNAGLSLNGFKHLMEKVRKDSGVKFHIHQFRHTFAVNLLNNGTDISKLRQLMGHSDIKMTAQYLRQIPQKALKDDVGSLSFQNML